MSDTTFAVSRNVQPGTSLKKIDYIGKLRAALKRPVEATWLPKNPLVACDDDHALLSAFRIAFYDHMPLRLSPDAIWITLARGFALHVNKHAERLRHRFVSHAGTKKLTVTRLDFAPGEDNPWPEVFDEFSEQLAEQTGGLALLVQADFSTTGPVERAVSRLMAMETFKAYFTYAMRAGCGIPEITLTGTVDDWRMLRYKAQQFADYGLEDWIETLDPILAQFELAKSGAADPGFWQSMFRYNGGSGPSVITGWANVLFPYLQDRDELYPNPYLKDWRQRLEIDDKQHWRERWDDPQGVGFQAIPSCFTSVPLTVSWGAQKTDMRLVGGLLGVTQCEETSAVEPECGWAVVYDTLIPTPVASATPKAPPPDAFDIIEKIDSLRRPAEGGIELIIEPRAERLDGSEEMARLLTRKIQFYLDQLNSAGFQAVFQHPPPDKTFIVLSCENLPALELVERVEQWKPWVAQSGATLVLRCAVED